MEQLKLNNIKPATGSRQDAKRKGRGIGSGLGKTAGRGHKGQKSRSGGFHKTGFEGGQMPLQRRLPKRGFVSMKGMRRSEVRLSEIDRLSQDNIDMSVLKAAGIVPHNCLSAKIILSGSLSRKVSITGLPVSLGARKAIEAAGGCVVAVPQTS